jgi:hypothetical protein
MAWGGQRPGTVQCANLAKNTSKILPDSGDSRPAFYDDVPVHGRIFISARDSPATPSRRAGAQKAEPLFDPCRLVRQVKQFDG